MRFSVHFSVLLCGEGTIRGGWDTCHALFNASMRLYSVENVW